MIHGINYALRKNKNWPVSEPVSLLKMRKKKLFLIEFIMHSAFSRWWSLSLSLYVRWDRLMEKQIKLITFEPQNDTNKTSLEIKVNEWVKKPPDHAMMNGNGEEKRFSITQADHMRIVNDAHSFSLWNRRQTVVCFSSLSYASCVRLRVFLSLN